jgi:hypothetical protein
VRFIDAERISTVRALEIEFGHSFLLMGSVPVRPILSHRRTNFHTLSVASFYVKSQTICVGIKYSLLPWREEVGRRGIFMFADDPRVMRSKYDNASLFP